LVNSFELLIATTTVTSSSVYLEGF